MRLNKYLAAAAALSLSTAPALADTVNPASSLSLSHLARAGSHSKHHNDLLGGGLIIAVVASVAVVVGVVVVANNSSSN